MHNNDTSEQEIQHTHCCYGQETMIPIDIQIELYVADLDNQLGQLISFDQYIEEDELQIRSYRKKAQTNLEEFLNENILGRKNEIAEIAKFIQNLRLGDKVPICLLGSTGCGKTSIMMKTFQYLKKKHCNQFQTLYINCLNCRSIKKIYTILLQQLFDISNISNKKPQQILQIIFANSQQRYQKIKLVVFDQIDQCISNQQFIYNILEWIEVTKQMFGVVLISNMVNFGQKLNNKCKSRIKVNQVMFTPYTYYQLKDIFEQKYKQLQLFQENVIMYLCKKVANSNSDVRMLQKLVDICQKQYRKHDEKIGLQQIKSWVSPQEHKIYDILKQYQFILQILWMCPKSTDIANNIQNYCSANNKKYREGEILYILSQLEMMKMIKISRWKKKKGLYYFHSWGIQVEEELFKIFLNS